VPTLTALLCRTPAPDAPDLEADLRAAGIHVLGAATATELVREAMRLRPDVVVCHETLASEALMRAIADVQAQSPCALVVFTSDPDAQRIDEATRAGAHAYVVGGYSAQRLRSVIHVAQARFRYQRSVSDELVELTQRFEERKLVDRAKGILMRARQMSEDEAYRTLRTVSMRANQRLGAVSQQVIAAAHYAEGVNSAGQLRMLSQRAVKLYAQTMAGVDPQAARELLAASVARIDGNLAVLARTLSKATFGDLVDAMSAPWQTLKVALAAAPGRARLLEIDALAEQLLDHADTLTSTLEAAGLAPTLRVINVSGRQRMLSQRLAKQALLGHLIAGSANSVENADDIEPQFEQALAYLQSIPLTDSSIRAALAAATQQWARLQDSVPRVDTPQGRADLAAASEALLETFEGLTERYERSMQTLMGMPAAPGC
jgi:AmiR/NasT family two-component response regulator